MHHHAQKAPAIAVAVLAATLLAGCAAGSNSEADNAASKTPSAATQSEPDTRNVRATKVIDPVTIIATPTSNADELEGKSVTVHINNIVTPEQGECGYDDALAFAKTTLVGNVWDLKYDSVTDGVYVKGSDHYGYLSSGASPYAQAMLRAGMARMTDSDTQPYRQEALDAQAGKVGLWGTCPDFGA